MIELGDWRDVLPGAYDPERAVVVTDPPFGLFAPGGSLSEGSHVERDAKGYPDVIPWAEHVAAVLELLPAVRHVIRGPAHAITRRDHPEPRRVCIEIADYRRRNAHRPGTVPYVWHGWAVYGRLKLARHARVPLGDAMRIHPYTDDGMRRGSGHRGLTPYGAAVWIVDTWADPGMIVVDPFAGTGTIGRAAAALGFDYLGAEIDERWHAEAIAGLGSSRPALPWAELG